MTLIFNRGRSGTWCKKAKLLLLLSHKCIFFGFCYEISSGMGLVHIMNLMLMYLFSDEYFRERRNFCDFIEKD